MLHYLAIALSFLALLFVSCENNETITLAEDSLYRVDLNVDRVPYLLASPGTDWEIIEPDESVPAERRLLINRRSKDGRREVTLSISDSNLELADFPKTYEERSTKTALIYRFDDDFTITQHSSCPEPTSNTYGTVNETFLEAEVILTTFTPEGVLRGTFKTNPAVEPFLEGTFELPIR